MARTISLGASYKAIAMFFMSMNKIGASLLLLSAVGLPSLLLIVFASGVVLTFVSVKLFFCYRFLLILFLLKDLLSRVVVCLHQ